MTRRRAASPRTRNFSKFGTGDVSDGGNLCAYIVQVKGNAFHVLNGGNALCGKDIAKD